MSIAEADLGVGARVVYPNQGICRVVGTTEMEIAGRKERFIKLSREDDSSTVMVPVGRLEKVGLRRIADSGELKKVFAFLSSPVEGPELDWKVRHRSHGERMSEGGLMGLAQVVKGLTALADLRPLPPKERELYDGARHLLVAEVAAAASLPLVSAEDAIDLALFPPGVERKKLAMALPLPVDGEDLPLDEVELTGELDEELAAPEPEEGAEAEAGEAEAEGEGEAEAVEEEKVEKPARGKAKAAKPARKAAPKAKPSKPAKAAKPAKAKPGKPAAAKAKEKAAPKKPAKAPAKAKSKAKK